MLAAEPISAAASLQAQAERRTGGIVCTCVRVYSPMFARVYAPMHAHVCMCMYARLHACECMCVS